MGEWSIYSKAGQVKAAIKKLEYNGEFMGERSVTATLHSPTPINLEVGDYLTYRTEVFSIDYDPSVLKQARRDTYGQGFVYDSVKFNSRQMELVHCKFLDYVMYDNQVHYSSLPTFSFYCETITNLTERIQANLNRLYTGGNGWTITVHPENVSVGRINIDIDGATCWDALALISTKFKSTFVIRGRTIEVAPTTNVLEGMFQYGKGNGLRSIARTSDAGQKIVTRLRAMGNTTNMPLNYYRNKNMYIYAPITEYLGPYYDLSLGADIHTTLQFNNCFNVRVAGQERQYKCMVSLDKSLWVHAIFTANTGEVGYSVCTVGLYESNTREQVTAFLHQLETDTYTRLYFKSGVDKDKWPSAYKEYTGVQVAATGVTRLMLPSYPDQTTDPYIDSANISKYGIREESVVFDGSGDLEDIFPTIAHLTAERAREAGATISLDAGDNGKLDEIVSATQITDDGIPAVDGEDKEMVSSFTITIKDIGFDINEYLASDNATISMRDGMCEGREFEITKVERSGNKYVLTCNRELDDSLNRYFPYDDYNLTAGDKFVLLNIEMPEIYIDVAAIRLQEAAEAYLAQIDHTVFVVDPKIDNIKVKRHDDEVDSAGTGTKIYDTIYEGMLMSIEDEDLGIDDAIFIDRLTIKEGESLIPEYEVVLRNEKTQGTVQQLQQQITDIKMNGTYGGNGNVDSNAVNQLIKNYTDRRFLRKDIIDILQQGVQLGSSFVSGLLGEGGIFRKDADGKTYIEADKLYIRMKAYFDTVEFRRYINSGGNRISSPAGGKCVKVEWLDSNGEITDNANNVVKYRCYFRATDGEGNEVTNDFQIGDQAYCHISNIRNGSLYQHEYWRTIIDRNVEGTLVDGMYWIDLANTSTVIIGNTTYAGYMTGSDAPVEQDSISTLGNKNDSTRRGAIIEYVSGEDSPSYKIYQDIGAGSGQEQFSLNDRNQLELGYNSQTGRAYMNVYGDFHFGSKTNTGSYITYNSSTGDLNIKAVLNATSPINDGGTNLTLEQYIKAHQNNFDPQPLLDAIDDLQDQIDGAQSTLFGDGDPTIAANDPYYNLTPTEKARHAGDMYYDNLTGYAYRYIEDNGTYKWKLIEDAGVTKALADAAAALGLAGTKGQIFTTQDNVLPPPPYNVNDIWVNATYSGSGVSYSNDILKCVQAKDSNGTAIISDWTKASNYTDDTKINSFITQILTGSGASGDAALAGTALNALKHALYDGEYYQNGGLVLANVMAVRNGQNVTAGLNGHLEATETGTDWKGYGIAAWYGGPMIDHEANQTASDYAKSLFRFDGSGYMAGGNITWDADGTVTIQNIHTLYGEGGTDIMNAYSTFSAMFNTSLWQSLNQIHPNQSFDHIDIVRTASTSTIGNSSVLTYAETKNSFLMSDLFWSLFDVYNGDTNYTATYKTSGLPQDTSNISIKAKFGFWTEKFISALGKNDDEGGSGGSTTLAGLTDVDVDSATNGQVLTYNVSSGLWVPTTVSGGSSAWADITGKPSTIAGYGITDAKIVNGVITLGANSITPLTSHQSLANYVTYTAMENALTGYLPLAGGTMTGPILSQILRPKSNNSYASGASSYRWSNVYSVLGNFSGLITASNSGIKIGSCTISWDSTNNMLKFSTGIYSEGAVSALGANSDSGGGGGGMDVDAMWQELSASDSSHQIHSSHLTSALSGYATQNYVTANAVTALGTSGNYVTWTKNGSVNNLTVPYATSAGALTNKSVDSTTINNTAGTFSFAGSGEPWTGTDWVGLQVGSGNDKFQITANGNTLLFRQNDSGGTNSTAWNDWVTMLTSGNIGSYAYLSTASRTANTVLAAPNGSAGVATFRALVAADIPNLAASKITSGTFDAARIPTNISITGNAATATSATTASKLSTVSKTAWGQTYWTTGGVPTNISGNMTSVGSITADYYKLNNTAANPYLQFMHTYSGTSYNFYVQAYQGSLWIGQGTTNGIRLTANGDLLLQHTARGFWGVDSTGFHYPFMYDNGENIWIGAQATAAQHHRGQTFISAGYNGTSGNSTIRICVPNADNNGGTNYYALHSGNYSDYLDGRYVKKTGDTMTGDLVCQKSKAKISVNNGSTEIGLNNDNDRGLWDYSTSRWLITTNGTNSWLNCGNVGIGTSSPSYKLHVNGSICCTALYHTNNVYQYWTDSEGTAISIHSLSSANNFWLGYGLCPKGYQLRIGGGSIQFYSGTDRTSRMFIASGGNVGIGTTSPNYNLHVNGTIYATGGVTALSDMRMKNKMVDLHTPIEELARLPLFYFKYKQGEDDYLHIGTSAQAVNEILPELVTKKDTWGLDYSVLGTTIGILNSRKLVSHEEEIKALKDEIVTLKQRIKTLEEAA